MNEADTSKNGAFIESLNSANLPQLEQASCPFYSVVPSENMAITKLPLLQPAKDERHETKVEELSTDATKQDWIAEPDIEKQASINSEFQKLLTLNEELRAANNDLYKQVEQYQVDLSESEKALQWQKKRFSVTESMLNQQAQELTAAQEQIKSLFQQLETAVQTVQRQEVFIETYKAQLQISQQRLAQLERECSLLQTNYTEQSQQLSQSETSCRELRTRLMRQQRQTLQFKAALEKCLETPVPGDDSQDDTVNHSHNTVTRQSRFAKKARSLFPNAQPIKPWSAEPESLTNSLDNSWQQSATPPSYTSANRTDPIPTSSLSSPWDWSIKQQTPAPAQPAVSSEIDDPVTTPEAVSPIESSNISDAFSTTSEAVLPSGSSNIDEQIENLIQMFFASQPASTSPAPNLEKDDVGINQANGLPFWETLATTIADDEESDTLPERQLEGEIKPTENTSVEIVEDYTFSLTSNLPVPSTSPMNETTATAENEDYWLEISQLTPSELPLKNITKESSEDGTIDTKSPSPVVYPQRPPKGRKSLASVELPNFRPNSQ
ncbi:MAG: hypothetical protein KME32_31175 [Mojavia pulchra JT2-VF2]|jgi:myosin heavy subunit|uniref:Uncharacterized protein n=1 Tax=Mojavia pulchra JT2-VF2 TaxID=287848 RepID=A0A951Q7C3_9NOST|nr:hypothetical protein [Mojavia pulchra JT2-VF2]